MQPFLCSRCREGFGKPLDLRKHGRVCSLDLKALLGQDELDRLRDAFETIDIDGNGTLDRGEVRAMAARVSAIDGVEVDEETLDTIFESMDLDGDGAITFEEFCSAMTPGGLERIQRSNQLVFKHKKGGAQAIAKSLACAFFLYPHLREWRARCTSVGEPPALIPMNQSDWRFGDVGSFISQMDVEEVRELCLQKHKKVYR
eukprot:TRINITY_DN17328_c0_g1_i1.p1 TRINITY_DN17328_c0_g1~~TRINITY_DN17328_c0_g1_i1.p1  ORF type:complete len:201 (+),score=42.90 TRINITY_DN17328_c0_g1_i1:183-785(+)